MCQRRSLRFESRGKGVVSLPANSYTVSFAKGPIEKVGRPELVQAPACPHSPSTPAIASPVVGPAVAVAVYRPRDEHGAGRHDDGWASHRGRHGHEYASSNTLCDRSNDEQRSGQTAESVASHVNPPIRLDAIGSDGISWGTVVRASSSALPPRRSGPTHYRDAAFGTTRTGGGTPRGGAVVIYDSVMIARIESQIRLDRAPSETTRLRGSGPEVCSRRSA